MFLGNTVFPTLAEMFGRGRCTQKEQSVIRIQPARGAAQIPFALLSINASITHAGSRQRTSDWLGAAIRAARALAAPPEPAMSDTEHKWRQVDDLDAVRHANASEEFTFARDSAIPTALWVPRHRLVTRAQRSNRRARGIRCRCRVIQLPASARGTHYSSAALLNDRLSLTLPLSALHN